MNAELEQYEIMIAAERQRFADRMTPFHNETRPTVADLFLIHFCSRGVGMTEPVEDWIRRAGENTCKIGYEELGSGLIRHAEHEAGHHELMIADTRSLVTRWNASHDTKLDPEAFLSQPLSRNVVRYRELHEEYIRGESPYCQIAIEYEIERISVTYGALFFARIIQLVGSDVLGCLSFIHEHVALDVGHTNYNMRLMERFLEKVPAALEPLVAAGARALDIYASHLEDCMQFAELMDGQHRMSEVANVAQSLT
ncbi:MAG TPA: hypothetical protein VF516_06145 [Kofleriaceae bacterium]